MASLSKAFLDDVQRKLARRPLEEGEFRRMDCAETYHLSLSPTFKGKSYLFEIKINGTKVYLYRG